MTDLKIAVSRTCPNCFSTQRNIVNTSETNFIDVAAVVLTLEDIECGKLDELKATGYNIPVFIAINKEEVVPAEYMASVQGYLNTTKPATTFTAASWKPLRINMKPSCVRRSLARWSITLNRATVPLTARGIRG